MSTKLDKKYGTKVVVEAVILFVVSLLDEIKKLPCYFWYIVSALLFEGSISVLFVLIGMIVFDTNYYYLTSAFLGGMWSHRMHDVYPIIRKISGYRSKLEAEEYLRKRIWAAKGNRLRRYLSILFFIADILLIVLYHPIII